MIVASYERDPGNAECLFPVVPRNHRINNTGNHRPHAPRNTAQPAKPQLARPNQRTS